MSLHRDIKRLPAAQSVWERSQLSPRWTGRQRATGVRLVTAPPTQWLLKAHDFHRLPYTLPRVQSNFFF